MGLLGAFWNFHLALIVGFLVICKWLYDKNKSYYNLESLLKQNNVDIFYFVCKYSKVDKADIEIASKYSKIHKFYFECDGHGVPFHSTILKRILSASKEDLISLSDEYNGQPIQPSFFWKPFFNRIEYMVIFSIHILRNFKKIPSRIFQRIRGSR